MFHDFARFFPALKLHFEVETWPFLPSWRAQDLHESLQLMEESQAGFEAGGSRFPSMRAPLKWVLYFRENPKWMRTGGTPIYGNPHFWEIESQFGRPELWSFDICSWFWDERVSEWSYGQNRTILILYRTIGFRQVWTNGNGSAW